MRNVRSPIKGLGAASAIAIGLACVSSQAIAQTPAENNEQADDGGAIVVTGSRGLERTVTDSPTPIDVISGEDLVKTGKTGVLSALNQMIPSFNQPTRAGGGTAAIISTGGLRGLNPDQALILVNGKRRHKTSLINASSALYNGSTPVDLDLIPVYLIERIEVLRDGAAAKYGSDAIAGVINIILKDDMQGGSASFQAGQNMDRSDGETFEANASLALPLSANGFLNLAVQAKKQLASNRARPIASTVNLYNLIGGARDPREATIDRLVTNNYGAFPQETLNSGINAQYDFGDVKLYAFGTYSQRRSTLNGQFRPANNINSLPEIYPNGFYASLDIREEDSDAALGLTGTIGGWTWDLSSTYGKNRARLGVFDTLNASLGPTSPTTFHIATQESSEWVNSLDLTRGYDIGSGNLQVSAGVQHRRERFALLSGDPSSYAVGTYVIPAGQPNAGQRPAPGSQGGLSVSPDDVAVKTRNNLAAYLDVSYDPSERLSLGAAGRFEHFDDKSGNTFNVQGTGRYEITPWLAVRGSVGTGFRAPTLAQQSYASTINTFAVVSGVPTLRQTKVVRPDSPIGLALGATPLKPEKSTSFSVGLVIEPASRLNFTVDAYQIDVRDRIAVTGVLTGAPIAAILTANGLPSNLSAQYYTNAIDTRTRGVDAVATYRATLGDIAKLRLNLGFNFNETKVTDVIPNPTQLSSLGANYVLFDRVARGNLTDLVPKTKVYLGSLLTIENFNLSTRLTRFGKYTIRQPAAAADQKFSANWIVDVEMSYDVSSSLSVALGANNLFNTYPDESGLFSTALGHQQYGANPASPFGFTGGYYYARVTVKY